MAVSENPAEFGRAAQRATAASGDLRRRASAAARIVSFLLLAAVPAHSGGPLLQAGDANQDLHFDAADFVLAQKAGKYETGLAASWAEGDWNGAPGGFPSNPPLGDGLFNSSDLVAAFSAGFYLMGPYEVGAGTPVDALSPIVADGVVGDAQTSLVYDPSTGELGVDLAAGAQLSAIQIVSASGIFTGDAGQELAGLFDIDLDTEIFKLDFSGFGDLSFGNVAVPGLSEAALLADLQVDGALLAGGDVGPVDLVIAQPLQAGDANQDLHFDAADFVLVQKAGKYETGLAADWSEGDWNGAPGGMPGAPPVGDGEYTSSDIVAAFSAGLYLQGPYDPAAGPPVDALTPLLPGGVLGDEQTSLVYDPSTGELAIDRADSSDLTAIQIVSTAGFFAAEDGQALDGLFDIDQDAEIFKFDPAGFGDVSFGNVAQRGIGATALLADLRIDGALAGGGDAGPIDLVYLRPFVFGSFDATRGGELSFDAAGLDPTGVEAAFPGVTFATTNVLTDAFLAGVDVLVIGTAADASTAIVPLDAAEQSALRAYVEAGGGALLVTDNDSFDAANANAANDSLVAPFGLDAAGLLTDVRDYTVTNPSHPLFDGPFGSVTDGSAFTPGWYDELGPDASALAALDTNGEVLAGAIDADVLADRSGAVVFFADGSIFDDPVVYPNALEHVIPVPESEADLLLLVGAAVLLGRGCGARKGSRAP